MSQRYFLTAEATYEELRQSLNAALAYPNALGKSVFQTALYAPRDNFRRVLLAVDTDLPGYATIDAAIAPLLDSDAIEEIDEATYLAALATATGGGATFTTVTDTLTYSNFLPSGGTLDLALQGINSAISAVPLRAGSAGTGSVRPAGDNVTGTDATNDYAFAIGASNFATGQSSFCGGVGNTASGSGSAVIGGFTNVASGENAFVTGGNYNTADAANSSIIGEANDINEKPNAHISGSHITASAADYTYVNNLHIVGAWNGTALAGGVLKFPDGTTMSTAGAAALHAHSVTADITAGNWKVLYSNGSGAIVELALGASGKVLTSSGTASAPTWETPSTPTVKKFWWL